MATSADVAKYIVETRGEMSAMKLHKLAYYCQAWHLVWREKELFAEDFQAWANGPVLRSIYGQHRKQFLVNAETFPLATSARLTDAERMVVDKVTEFYGMRTAQWLSDLTHTEAPWLQARQGLAAGEPSENVIDKASMHEYYSSL